MRIRKSDLLDYFDRHIDPSSPSTTKFSIYQKRENVSHENLSETMPDHRVLKSAEDIRLVCSRVPMQNKNW